MFAGERTTRTRERLITAATAVIAERGYTATRVQDVISQASCARDTFYQHFRDMEDCFVAALDRAAGEPLAKLRHATAGAQGVDAARSVVSALVGYACEEPVSARLLLLEALGGGPRALALRDRLVTEAENLIENSSKLARRSRRVIDLTTATLVGGTFRLLAIRLHRGTATPDELRSGLLGWIDAYFIPSPRGASAGRPFPVIEPPADFRLSRMGVPPPLPPGRHRLGRDEVARNQRERILHATAAAVYQYTYTATTVRDIVAHAGVSRTVFYRHFRDRTHAAIEANELSFRQCTAAAAGAFFPASGWPEGVWAAGHAMTAFLAANPAMSRLGFVEFHAISPIAIRRTYEYLSSWTLFLEGGFAYRVQGRGLPRLCAEAIPAAIFEFGYRGARGHPAAAELPTMLPAFAYVILAPFLGPDEATDFVEKMTDAATINPGAHGD